MVDEKYINELIYFENFENTLREIDNELSEGLGGLNSNLNVGESEVEVVGSLSSISMPEKVDKEPIENMVVIQDLESHLNKHIPLHELDELANSGVYFNMGCEKQDKVRKTRIGKLRTWTRIPKFK